MIGIGERALMQMLAFALKIVITKLPLSFGENHAYQLNKSG